MKNIKWSIKTIFVLLTFCALTLTIAVGLWLSTASKNRLIFDESKRFFEQSIATVQIILDNEVEKIFSLVRSTNFSQTQIDAIKTKNIQTQLKFLNDSLPQSLDFNAIIPVENPQDIVLSGFLLYDTKALKKELQTIQTASAQKQLLKVRANNQNYLYLIASKAVIDSDGEVVGIFAGGIELNNNVRLLNKIKANTNLDKIALFCGDSIIVDDSKSNYKNTLMIEKYNEPVFNENKVICYRKSLQFDAKKSSLNIKAAIFSKSIKSAKDMILNDLIFIVIFATLIIVAFVYLINQILIKPIERLKSYTKEFLKDTSAKEQHLQLNIKEYQELSNYLYGLFSKLLYNQKKLMDLNDLLEHKVKEKTQKLTKQMEEMGKKDKLLQEQAKLASMGEMIDAIAHQWKTPLTSISFYAQDLEYILKENNLNIADADEDIEGILVKVEHLVDTINSFREFFRPVSVIEPISVKELIESTILLMKDELLQYNINTHIKGDDIDIFLIPNEFKHILINLISNSKDAFIQNEIQRRDIIFEIDKISDYEAKIKITDSAGGIPKKVIDHIFEPHFTTKEKDGGTGIGLYVSKLILDKIGADIKVTNVHGGALFEITVYNACNVNITKLHT